MIHFATLPVGTMHDDVAISNIIACVLHVYLLIIALSVLYGLKRLTLVYVYGKISK